jgi:hypothetical protein
MKRSLLLWAFVISINAYSQKQINEGTISYNISIETVRGEKQLASPLNGAILNLYVTKEKSRTEMTNKLGVETIMFDNKAGKGFILKEYSGQKLMITTSAENWAQKNQANSALDFKISDETMVIAGYTCKKAIATSADGKNSTTVYFDPSVLVANKTYNNAFPQIEGIPVQYELQSGNMVFKYTLSKYTTEVVPAARFDAPKAGFRTMTYEENQQLKKGG